MTIFARDLDTGMAKWVYQMTPHDEWDFDGVNEMLLVDVDSKGKKVPAVVHFDRNGFGYTLNRDTGELLVAEKYDPQVNWATKVDMKTGRPIVDKKYSPGTTGPDVNVKDICPAALGSKDEQPASYDRKTRPDHGADQPRVHDVRAIPGGVHRRTAVRGCDADHVPHARKPRGHGQLHRLGSVAGQDRLVEARTLLGVVRRTDHRRRCRRSTARWRDISRP